MQDRSPTNTAAPDPQSRLVRNLMALRLVLSLDQMQSGKWAPHLEEIDEALADLGHDMKSTAACAADNVRRTFLLPRLVSRRTHPARRPSARATPRE